MQLSLEWSEFTSGVLGMDTVEAMKDMEVADKEEEDLRAPTVPITYISKGKWHWQLQVSASPRRNNHLLESHTYFSHIM